MTQMIKISKIFKKAIQWFGLGASLLIVGMVILVFLGRQTIGQLDEIRPSVKAFIATNTGFRVNLGALSGEWPQLIPIIEIDGVELIDTENDPILSLQGARADLDLFSSLKLGAPIWRELAIDKLDINFVENASGHWRLKGFNSESESDLDIILQPFLNSHQIRLESVTVNLHSFSGQKTQLFGQKMLIENDKDFHRAQLSLSIEEGDNPAYLIIEAYGEPSDLNSFNANGYLKFEELNVYQSLKFLAKSLMPDLSMVFDQHAIKASGEVWLDFHPEWQFDYEGELSITKIPLSWLGDDVAPVSDIKTIFTGWYMPGEDWGASLNELQFDIGSTSLDSINLIYTQQLGLNWQEFDVLIEYMDLALVTDLIYETQALPKDSINNLKSISPSGDISSLTIGRSEQGLYLTANVNDSYTLPFSGIPGLKKLNGYIELKDSKGLFHIADNNGFEILFPKSYQDYLSINQAKGTIYFDWEQDNQRLIYSDMIDTTSEAGDSLFKFSIELPPRGVSKAAEFNLLIGARDLDLALNKNYLPKTIPEQTSRWMKKAIEEGNLTQFGLLFRSGPPKNNRLSRTMQLLFETENAAIKFNQNWPKLDKLDGIFLVDNGNLSAQIRSADMEQAKVNNTRIEYSVKPPVEQRKWIINGQLEADFAAMIDILAQSPLSQRLGPMANWNYAGNTRSQLYMELPSYSADKEKSPASTYKLSSIIDNGKIKITGSPIILDALTGAIEFSSEKGIFSDSLNALLWKKPFTAKLHRENQQQLSFTTAITPNDLSQFVDFPWPNIISETIAFSGSLFKDPNHLSKTILEVKSDMQGVAINLPAPIGKTAEQSQLLELKLHFEPSLSRLEGKFGEYLLSDIRFDQGKLKRGVVGYDYPLVMPDQDMLLISANLPTINFSLWQPFSDMMDQSSQHSMPLETVFDLKLAQWKISGIELSEINARVKSIPQGFDATYTSDLADGTAILYHDVNRAPKIALNRLELSESFGSSSVNLDPRLLMATDFSVDWLSIAGRELGSLSFELRPEPSGASFNNISGSIQGLQPGIYAAEAPTDFFWGYDGKTHLSKLVGPVGIDNIGDLFSVFGMPQVLDSQSGRLDADLSWRGHPWSISKENLNGDFKINLVEGNFYRTPGSAGAALKLVGLFNFANWLRRLQLDFSDVIGQNLAYNRLDGTLSFDQAILGLDEPLKIQMPSGRMSMAGNFDLIDETIDAQLVATLPVATNLPWVVGLTGGLPAALGVYVTSKLLEKQVDRISSISYELSGSWDDVEVAVDKIFAAELTEPNE